MYKNENVGKRMKEIATTLYKVIFYSAIAIAICEVIGGIIWAIDWESFWLFLAGLVSGAISYFLGSWLATLAYIRLYGFGVAVDRIENLKPEYFVDTTPPVAAPAAASDAPTIFGQHSPSAHSQSNGSWYCACGYRNASLATNCYNCNRSRP